MRGKQYIGLVFGTRDKPPLSFILFPYFPTLKGFYPVWSLYIAVNLHLIRSHSMIHPLNCPVVSGPWLPKVK